MVKPDWTDYAVMALVWVFVFAVTAFVLAFLAVVVWALALSAVTGVAL